MTRPSSFTHLRAYRRVGPVSHAHLRWRDVKTRRDTSGWILAAGYELHGTQPGEATLRDTLRWRAWCIAEAARLPPG